MSEKPQISKLAQLKSGARPTKIIKWPGTDVDVALRVPTELEYERARYEAWAVLEKSSPKGIDPDKMRGGILYESEVISRALFAALVDPASGPIQAPFCASLEDLKKNSTPQERALLIRELADFTNETDPDLDTEAGIESANAIADEIEKKRLGRAAMELLLNATPPRTLRRCIITMAERLRTLLEAKSGPSSAGAGTNS